MASLAFCPPDKFTPFSPISVWSPWGKINKSCSSWHIFIILLYFSLSIGLKNSIFCSIVSFNIQAFWETKLIFPDIFIFPFKSSLLITAKLFIMELSKQVFPLPTSPIIPICSPFFILKLILVNKVTSSSSSGYKFFSFESILLS